MKHDIVAGDTFPMARVYLDQGETVRAESGAMVAMTRDLRLHGKVDGGIFKAVARMFAGEKFFLQQITAEKGPGWVLLAAAAPGEIRAFALREGEKLTVQKNGFLAGSPGIELSTVAQGIAKGFFSGEGFFLLEIGGKGTVFLSTYGAMYEINLPAGEELLVDNGHLVAWDSAMDYSIVKGASSWTSSVTGGEGLACRFQGPGRLVLQSRNPQALSKWLLPFLPIPRQAPPA